MTEPTTPTIDPNHPIVPIALAAGQVLQALAAELVGNVDDRALTSRNCRNLASAAPPFYSALAAAAATIAKAHGVGGPESADAGEMAEYRRGITPEHRAAAKDLRALRDYMLRVLLREGQDDAGAGDALAWVRKRQPRLADAIAALLGQPTSPRAMN